MLTRLRAAAPVPRLQLPNPAWPAAHYCQSLWRHASSAASASDGAQGQETQPKQPSSAEKNRHEPAKAGKEGDGEAAFDELLAEGASGTQPNNPSWPGKSMARSFKRQHDSIMQQTSAARSPLLRRDYRTDLSQEDDSLSPESFMTNSSGQARRRSSRNGTGNRFPPTRNAPALPTPLGQRPVADRPAAAGAPSPSHPSDAAASTPSSHPSAGFNSPSSSASPTAPGPSAATGEASPRQTLLMKTLRGSMAPLDPFSKGDPAPASPAWRAASSVDRSELAPMPKLTRGSDNNNMAILQPRYFPGSGLDSGPARVLPAFDSPLSGINGFLKKPPPRHENTAPALPSLASVFGELQPAAEADKDSQTEGQNGGVNGAESDESSGGSGSSAIHAALSRPISSAAPDAPAPRVNAGAQPASRPNLTPRGKVAEKPASSSPPTTAQTQPTKSRTAPKPTTITRCPVVTIMGHVDHGKTTLLDALRKTSVAAGEAGGITQHIGAFTFTLPSSSQQITFLDTPGHQAFSAMRRRGASVTDVVVLVVAADDGVMPQTLESIEHARRARVPLVVAVNKCDKPGTDKNLVLSMLKDAGVHTAPLGGDVPAIEISALKQTNLDTLVKTILSTAAKRNLKANPVKPATGYIIEAKSDKLRGIVATALVRDGTLSLRDNIVADTASAKVRLMTTADGAKLSQAGPSQAVEILGWKEMPQVGASFAAFGDEKEAKAYLQDALQLQEQTELEDVESAIKADRDVVDYVKSAVRDLRGKSKNSMSNHRYAMLKRTTMDEAQAEATGGEDEKPVLRIVLKTDVSGSLEAVTNMLATLPDRRVRCEIISSDVGPISSSDIEFAASTNAHIFSFNAPCPKSEQKEAETAKVPIHTFNIIYDLMDTVKEKMLDTLPDEPQVIRQGDAQVLKVFKLTGAKKSTVAGCVVKKGKLLRNMEFVVERNGEEVFRGPAKSLKINKDDANQVDSGRECGLSLEGFEDIQEGDQVFCIEHKMGRPTAL